MWFPFFACFFFSSYFFFVFFFFSFHFFLLALSSFPGFVFLIPRFLLPFLLSLAAPSLLSVATTPAPLPLFHSFLLSFLLVLPSFLLFLFSLLISDPTVFSSASFPLPSSTPWVLSFLHLSLLHRPFLPFLLFSFSCLFLNLAFSSSFSSFSLALLLSFLLGFPPLSVWRFVFLRFPFACFCVLAVCGFVFRFYLLLPSFSPLLVSVFLRSVFRFSFLSASPFFLPFRLSSSAVFIPPRFFYLLLAICFCCSLPATPPPHPPTPLVPLRS